MDDRVLQSLCRLGDSLYQRGYAFGSTGNLSVRVDDQIWITPTGRRLTGLDPDQLAHLDHEGKSWNENVPSKEFPFHLGIYRQRADVQAVVHLHSLYSVALSCLKNLNVANPLPPLTPYFFMRVAPLAVLPYFRPGSHLLADAVERAAVSHNCMLLRNHGGIGVGSDLAEAMDRMEELEQTARLYFLLRGERLSHLTREEIADLKTAFS